MIETYKNSDDGKVKVFFVLDDNDNVESIKTGNQAVPTESGYQFYVDDYVAEQIDKVGIDFNGKPSLVVKDGETIEEPVKTEKELEIERLERELEKIKNAE